MRALTVSQPFASMIMEGLKRVETRVWYATYRGPIAIHASLRPSVESQRIADLLGLDTGNHPAGCVLGVVRLVAIYPTEELRNGVDLRELQMGDFADGRFGWVMADPDPFPMPITAMGRQRLWDWKL